MNGKEVAEELGLSRDVVRGLMLRGEITAEKSSGRWSVEKTDLEKFRRQQRARTETLKNQYVAMYWQGVEVDALKRRTRQDCKKHGIVLLPVPASDFAEQTIYDSLPKVGDNA